MTITCLPIIVGICFMAYYFLWQHLDLLQRTKAHGQYIPPEWKDHAELLETSEVVPLETLSQIQLGQETETS